MAHNGASLSYLHGPEGRVSFPNMWHAPAQKKKHKNQQVI